MRDFRICMLYSGSTGNSLYIKAAGREILIDAGRNAKALCNALSEIGTDISNISAIFVTHEHTDHVSALEIISKRYEIPVHMTEVSAEKFDRTPNAFIHKNLVRHGEEYEVLLGDMRVSSFRTPHDSRMSVGYRVDFSDDEGAHSIGVATDIGYVTNKICSSLEGCEAVVLESNHDIEMLERGPYPYELKMRILSRRGHLSNKESSLFGAHLAQTGTRSFMLAHLSEENNDPEIAFDEFTSALADERISVSVAAPDHPTEMIFKDWSEEYAFC